MSESFVSSHLFGSDKDVGKAQAWLAENAQEIRGRKVVLVKTPIPDSDNKKFVYDVHMQHDDQPGDLLARTSSQLTFDILRVQKIFGRKGYSLPSRIYNLRIAEIVTMSASPDDRRSAFAPWNVSGMWVGIRIHGIGFFRLRNLGNKKARKRKKR